MSYNETPYTITNPPPALQWRYNERNSVSNHRRHDCLRNRLFRRRSKKTSKLRVTGLCEGNSPVTGEFRAQRTSNTENVSIWWRHHKDSTIDLFFEAWWEFIDIILHAHHIIRTVKHLCALPCHKTVLFRRLKWSRYGFCYLFKQFIRCTLVPVLLD